MRNKQYLIFGFLWLVIGLVAVAYDAKNIFYYGYLLMAVIYFGVYFFQKNK